MKRILKRVETFRLKLTKNGAIFIKFLKFKEGNVVKYDLNSSFCTPDSDGERFEKLMKSLKKGSVIFISIETEIGVND